MGGWIWRVPGKLMSRRLTEYEECGGIAGKTPRSMLMGETEDWREVKCLVALRLHIGESEKMGRNNVLPFSR